MASPSRRNRVLPCLVLAAAFALSGCASDTPFDNLKGAQPSGSPFARALFTDYAYLARSFGLQNAPSGTAFDAAGSLSLAAVDSETATVANTYASKALTASKGEEPLPEGAPPDDQVAENLRLRLLRALNHGRAKAPVLAAQTQVEFDCWILNGTVDELAAASAQCRSGFMASLSRLESAAQ
ncbi:MAG: hypothetical protein KGR48_01160 [Alphaproteobacteria bacterium]|nr:hypothetical protein [Alphaproteobacteria bacterium]MBU6471106.1 hypothetical protein [Alphaproteobacteria bacterium]MDE2012183.1 hypothetical protein [Alphaproteobacteria bacterium]MDE2072196.1 hypothetical protein [Alphaproteobacteria bacterium]MDE2351755.1 hypothetical protein [Alphaproteobacteria bacterium]